MGGASTTALTINYPLASMPCATLCRDCHAAAGFEYHLALRHDFLEPGGVADDLADDMHGAGRHDLAGTAHRRLPEIPRQDMGINASLVVLDRLWRGVVSGLLAGCKRAGGALSAFCDHVIESCDRAPG